MYPNSNPPYPNSHSNSGYLPAGVPHNPGVVPNPIHSSGFAPVQYPGTAPPPYPPSPNYAHNIGPSPPYPGSQFPAYPPARQDIGFVNAASPLGIHPSPGYPSQSPLPAPGQPFYPNPSVNTSSVGLGHCPPQQSSYPATGGNQFGSSLQQPSTGYSPALYNANPPYNPNTPYNPSTPYNPGTPSSYPGAPQNPGTPSSYPGAPQNPSQNQLYPNSQDLLLQKSTAPLSQAHSLLTPKKMSLQPYYETPTIRDGPYDPMADAQALRKAMKGFGTDEKAIINVLAKRTNNQRLQIANSYKQSFGKDLLSDLKSETSGKFEEVLVAMMTPRYDYMAQRLRSAMSGIGTKEMILIDILCSATNQELRWIQASYARLYNTQLEKDISNDTSGCFRRLLVSLCVAQRSEDTRLDPGLIQQDAQALLSAGMKKWGTDESVFNMIMATRSYAHLREVFHEYEKISGQDIERTINAEFSGDIKDAMNAIVKSVKNRASYFAQRLRDSMKGMGTNDGCLIFLIVTRAEVDLENIKQEYNRLYSKSLADDIKADTSGDYQKTLHAMLF